MTKSSRTVPWLRLIAIVGLLANAVYWGVSIAAGSTRPDGAFLHFRPNQAWVYPTSGVAISLGLMLLELAAAAVLLWRMERAAHAMILGTCGYGAIFTVTLPLIMHAPLYIGWHLSQLLFATGWLLLMSGVAVLSHLLARAVAGPTLAR